jgi:hypothetical protein
LSGTAKQKAVLDETGMARTALPEFFGNGNRVDKSQIAKLLAAMKGNSRPIKPPDLGVIGREHLSARFAAAGADLETFRYRRAVGEDDGRPYVIEGAFGCSPHGEDERRIVVGVNWSPVPHDPFRSLRDGESLGSILTKQRAGQDEPIVIILYLACPHVEDSRRRPRCAQSDDRRSGK